jgi:hypothetical protein
MNVTSPARSAAPTADVLTIDVYTHPVRQTPARRRRIARALAHHVPGLRAWSINYANTGTFTVVPKPLGTCLLMAWDSLEAAGSAWSGPLGDTLGGPGDFRLDGEVARARTEHPDDTWFGWRPSDAGAASIARDEPLVVVVHGLVKRRNLAGFLRDNVHAASRAAHHPGHRGSIDIHSRPPFENTSVSVWSTLAEAQDFAYAPGGHAPAMKRARTEDTHEAGVYLQVRPVASTGSLGIDRPALPELPGTAR